MWLWREQKSIFIGKRCDRVFCNIDLAGWSWSVSFLFILCSFTLFFFLDLYDVLPMVCKIWIVSGRCDYDDDDTALVVEEEEEDRWQMWRRGELECTILGKTITMITEDYFVDSEALNPLDK